MRRKIVCIAAIFSISIIAIIRSSGIERFKYESKGKRDPLVPLIGSGKNISTGLEGISSIEDVSLEGIAVGAKGKRIAVINGQLMKENEKVGNLKIEKITNKTVTLSIDDKVYDVNLPEEGGAKSNEK